MVHFYMSREHKRRHYKSMADFQPSALCGNGQPIMRIKTTDKKAEVTCQACLHLIT